MSKVNEIELLNKIKRLAESGIAGEREAASKLLKKLLNKYNLSVHDLDGNSETACFFTYKTKFDLALLSQILYKVLNQHKIRWCKYRYKKRWKFR